MPDVEYIYKLECKANGKVYVGRTCDVARRKQEHFRKLRKSKHQNKHMQSAYNKYGEDSFEFSCIEETTSDKVKQRELYYFNLFLDSGTVLFNHNITSSEGGVDSKSNITRTYVFDILDKRLSEVKSYKQLSREYGIGTTTLLKYIEEWEELRGIEMPKSTQSLLTFNRISLFVDEYTKGTNPRYMDFNLSTQSLHKYLPYFGLTFNDVRLDLKFTTTKQRTLQAIQDVSNGMKLVDAWSKNDISYTTYYKYLKETQCT